MADLENSAIQSQDEDEPHESQPNQEQRDREPHAPGEAGEGGAEAGETLHLLREDAFDHFIIERWQSNVPVNDEVSKIRNSLGGSRNAAKIRNRVSSYPSPLFKLHNF
jgi:hypothetical protein